MQKAVRSILILSLVAACGGPDLADGEDTADIEYGAYVHKLPLRDESAPVPQATSAHLTYYGGKVLASVKVVQVLYGSGTYASSISGTQLGAFYSGVTASTYMDWLKEYDTPSQSVGRGKFVKKVSITPAASRDKATITDSSIQAEISAQIGKGILPAPDGNTLYMVNFPKGSHQPGRVEVVRRGRVLRLPRDLQAQLDRGVLRRPARHERRLRLRHRLRPGSAFNNQTSVASHEMIEAVTDAEVGLATTLGAARLVRLQERRDRRHLQRPAGHRHRRRRQDVHGAEGVVERRQRLRGAPLAPW